MSYFLLICCCCFSHLKGIILGSLSYGLVVKSFFRRGFLTDLVRLLASFG